MSSEPETRPIAAIFLGARIPFEHVGAVLKLLYAINADGFEIAPHFEQLPGAEPLQLPDRSQASRKKQSAAPVQSGTFYEFIFKQLRRGPKSAAKLRALALKAGTWNLKSLAPRLSDLCKRGLVKQLPDGTYVAKSSAKSVAKSAPSRRKAAAPKSRSKSTKATAPSQVGLILSRLKHAHPSAVPLSTLRNLLAKHDLRAASASVAINQLKKKGLVAAAAGRANYVYQPPKESADAVAATTL